MSLRQYERLSVNIAATIHSRNGAITARLENLSITGARLKCFGQPIALGESVNLSVLGELHRSIVVWTGTLAFGVNFATPLVKGQLYELLARNPELLLPRIAPGYPLQSRPDGKMI
jgi:hypothetical protein